MSFGRRYQLHELIGVGGMGQVYRAYDRLTGQFVALKSVTTPGDSLDFTSRFQPNTSPSSDLKVALAGEFRVLVALRHPHIVSVLDYGFDASDQPYFTMDLLEKARPLDRAARSLSIEERLRLISQVLQALAYLHRHGIIHRDLKPGNVLVVNHQVKVVDFGLAVTRREEAEGMVGTPAYVAPEILTGQIATIASDLYCVGVLAYEIIAGEHPFRFLEDGMTGLMRRVILGKPDMDKLPVEEGVRYVISRLMARHSYDRFESAQEALEALQIAMSMTVETDTPAQRESFLQAAQFIGRAEELNLLIDHLANARAGQGSGWLIAGESGAGKTRLMDEVRSAALVNGMSVLRGRAPAEPGTRYGLLADVLRYLSLIVPLDEEEASLLQLIIPDISRLVGNPVPIITLVDPQTTQRRLMNLIETLFRRVQQPILVLLEDMHNGNESLPLIGHLTRFLPEIPVMLIGSYREEETPHLSETLPAMQLIRLARFEKTQTEALMVSILGDKAAKQPELVELIHRETEGNPFFVIEVLRSLADITGRLEDIGQGELPEHVFSQGIQEIARFRLKRLPMEYYPVLYFAAVLGRDIDFALLRHVYPHVHYDDWLVFCSDAGLLELIDHRWSFTHEKIREGILRELREPARRILHIRAAETLEAVYGISHETIARLSYHYSEAGQILPALKYATQVVTMYTISGALQQALDYGVRALHLAGLNPENENLVSIKQQMQQIQDMFHARSREQLLEQPPVGSDMIEGMLIELLMTLHTPARMLGRVKMYSYFVLHAMSLTLTHGSTGYTPLVYVTFGIVYHSLLGNIRTAYLISQMGIELSKQRHQSAAYYYHTAYIDSWMNPLRDTVIMNIEGARSGFEQGDGLYGTLNLMMADRLMQSAGFRLEAVIQSAAQHLERTETYASLATFDCLLEMQFAKALSGQTESSISLTDDSLDEEIVFVSTLGAAGQSQAANYYLKKLMLHYLAGNNAVALHYADRATRLLDSMEGQFSQVEFTVFHALALAAEQGSTPDESQQFILEAYADMLERWSGLCKANFEHKALLVRAEIARLRGEDTALSLYQAAAESAEHHRFMQYAALSYELAARYCQRTGRRMEPFFSKALLTWKNLGAVTKVIELQKL